MGTQAALRFIAAVREDTELLGIVRELGPEATLESLVTLGGSRGFKFTADDLRAAYKIDWTMRAARYFGGEASGQDS
jgi:hypothetical protein